MTSETLTEIDDRPPDRQDLDAILHHLLAFAHQTLERNSEFYPFGASMTMSGEIKGAMGHEEAPDDRPKPQALMDVLTKGFSAEAAAGTIRAAGMAYDIKWQGEDGQITDAIAVSLDHRSGRRVLVAQPYSRSRLRGWRFEELVAVPSDWTIFPAANANT